MDRAHRWKIPGWERRRGRRWQLAVLQLQMRMAGYREHSPQRPVIADLGSSKLRMSLKAL
jgi:hypothetical protein